MRGRTRAPNANGHRRRLLVQRIKATATHCALCDGPLFPDRRWPDPLSTVIDEDLPRARGGDPLSRANTNAMHARCNSFKGTMTLAEARQVLQAGFRIEKPPTKKQIAAIKIKGVGEWESGAAKWTSRPRIPG